MNLYIIEGVLCDYTSGMVVIAAENINRCRELFVAEFESGDLLAELDEAILFGTYKVLSVNNQPEGIVSYMHGGG